MPMILPSNIERERKSNGGDSIFGFFTALLCAVCFVAGTHAFRKSALDLLLYFGLMLLQTW